jgi:hypothetical protein
MANIIKCPVCGENNLSDQEFCQSCQSRLQPLTGKLKGEDKPLTPGQAPTKKNTAELEPVLPQWLREARTSARQSSEENAQQPPQAPRSTFSGADLLAGLQSQSQEDEEDTPDWLASITGEKPKPKKSQVDSSEVRWVELGDKKDFAQQEPEPEVPPWLTGINPSTSQADEKDELTDWLRNANSSQASQQPAQPLSFDNPPSTPTAGETQDWLHSMGADDGSVFNDAGTTADEPFTSSDTPDWLRALDAESAASKPSTPSSALNSAPAFVDTPDWLRTMAAESVAPSANAPSGDADAPDWLHAMGAENAAQNVPSGDADAPDWLRTMDGQDITQGVNSAVFSGTGSGESDAAFSSAGDTPDWLKGFQSAESQQPLQDSAPVWLDVDAPVPAEKSEQEQPPAKDDADLDVPSWLKAAAPQSSIFTEPPAGQEAPVSFPSSSDVPDWLDTFKSVDTPANSAPPAFVGDAKPTAGTDALFTEMPDWLSIVDDSSASPESISAPIKNMDGIAPGELPSWVQAMRPVDTGISQPSTSSPNDKTSESHGALAGLQGVLPAVPGFSPTSKPKAYSIKLQASEEQQAHAALLEQILSAETAPVPIGSFSTLGTSRGLRWLLAFLFFAILAVVLSMQTQLFALPNSLLIGGELQVAQSIPEDSRVLTVFDYEPARAGELEAAAVPMFDQMILLRHPRLTFISTSETGAILAERFISSGPLSGHNYQSGSQYLNLGYLPGGQMGIRAFAENPSLIAQYPFPQSFNFFDFAPPAQASTFPPLEGVSTLSNFAVLILITDNADSARVWIEQTTSARGAMPVVVVSSAQAAPMIQPYYASHQINGLVSGIYGGALFEQNNAGRPGTARAYWDAYSIGMLLAMALILGGGLVNLVLGLRDRAAAREAK